MFENLAKWVTKHKKALVLVIIIAVLFCVLLYQLSELTGAFGSEFLTKTSGKLLFTAGIAGIAFICLMYWLVVIKSRLSMLKAYIITMCVLCLAYILIFTPYTVPDEDVHYYSAYKLSNVFFLHFDQLGETELLMRQSDFNFDSVMSKTLSKEGYITLRESFEAFSSANELTVLPDSKTAIGNAPVGYIFSALGIFVARIFNLGALPTFYMGRIFNIAFYILVTARAIKKIPFGKMALFAISTLPMTLHLVASYSYDAVIIAIAIMLIAQILSIKYSQDKCRIGEVAFLTVLGMALAPQKLVYVPLIFTVLTVPNEKFASTKRRGVLVKCGIALAAVFSLCAVQFTNMLNTVASRDTSILWTDEPSYTVSWILHNIPEAFEVFVRSFIEKADFYFSTMLGANLGWFQISIFTVEWVPFGFILFLSFMRADNEGYEVKFMSKLWVFCLTAVSVVLIMTSMLVSWTPVTYNIIEGVQGRYFIPLLPYFAYILYNRHITVKADTWRYLSFAIIVFQFAACMDFFVRAFV